MEFVQTKKIKPFIAKNLKELTELYARKAAPEALNDADVLKRYYQTDKIQSLLALVESKPESSSEIMTSAGTALALRLKAPAPNDQMTEITTAFANCLAWDNETKESLNKLHVDITVIEDQLKKKEIHPSILAGRLEQICQDATAIFEQQCQKEKDDIYALFTDARRNHQIHTCLGVVGPGPHQDALRDKLIDRIEKNKNEQIKALKESIDKEVALLENNDRAKELAGIHSMFLANSKNKKQIMRFMAKKEQGTPGVGFSLSQESKEDFLDASITLNDFQPFTINGNKMTVNGKQISVSIPAIGIRYNYLSLHNRPFYDFTSITNYARAQGCTHMDMFVDYPNDEDYAMALAAMQAEACFISGFYKVKDPQDPNKMSMAVTFKVNGENKTLEQIFAKNPERLQILVERWEKDEKIRNTVSLDFKKNRKEEKQLYKKTFSEIKKDPEEMARRSIDLPMRAR